MSAPWADAFIVEGNESAHIELVQIDENEFMLRSRLTYTGLTGLEGRLIPEQLGEIRSVDELTLVRTDLASVPLVMRWLVGPYGAHTPAALVHDRLIRAGRSGDALVTDAQADRYFRYMLAAVGVPLLMRWIMWSGVALRTRWVAGGTTRLMLVIWLIASVAGLSSFVVAITALGLDTGGSWAVDPTTLLVGAAVAPFVFSVLWERQYGAGIVAAAVVPWMLPPAVLATAGYAIYRVIEAVLSVAGRLVRFR